MGKIEEENRVFIKKILEKSALLTATSLLSFLRIYVHIHRRNALRYFFILIFFLLIYGLLPALDFPYGIQSVRADVIIDSSVSNNLNDNKGQPALVFINDTVGYMFYRDYSPSDKGTCGYSKTTNSGGVWSANVQITAQTDCVGIAVWYDQWTPGDTNGNFIHVIFIESGGSAYYIRFNTANDSKSTEVQALNATSLSNVDKIAITKATNGIIYIGLDDADTAGVSKVRKCSINCDTTEGWSNAGISTPLEQTNDPIRLMPLANDNILIIRDDISLEDIQSKVYTASSDTWDPAWTTVDANASDSTTYLDTIAATVDRYTNNIYLAYGANVGAAGTAAIRTAIYNGSSWTLKTDVINASNTITNLDIARDENTGDIYVGYLRGTAGSSMNAYYKNSTNDMSSWSAERQFNTNINLDLYWMYLNRKSTERIYAVHEYPRNGNKNTLYGNTLVDLIDKTPPL